MVSRRRLVGDHVGGKKFAQFDDAGFFRARQEARIVENCGKAQTITTGNIVGMHLADGPATDDSNGDQEKSLVVETSTYAMIIANIPNCQ